jgi:segregation and condensation protein B
MNKKNTIEAVLFSSSKPLSAHKIAQVCNMELADARIYLDQLHKEYQAAERGMLMTRIESEHKILYQMVSHPDAYEAVASLHNLEVKAELSRPALEALTIIAYRGPLSKHELEKIRGVNCTQILRNLMIRGLVIEETMEHDVHYSVTGDFLNYLGITSVQELPDYDTLKSNELVEDLLNPDA